MLLLRRSILPALFLAACASLQADVTMRMSLDMKINMAIPTGAPQLPFNEMVTRIKGDRSYASMGPIIAITDISTGRVTLLDPKTQHYAAVAMADYVSKLTGGNGAAAMDNMPEEAKQILAKIKFDTESRDTGRTSRIQGIDAVEREVVVNMSIPVPIPGQENGLQINMKFQVWKPKPSELERVPALRELAAYNQHKGLNDPATLLRQMFGKMPGMGENAGKMVEEISKGGNVTLGMHIGIFMPGLAKMMEQARAKGAAVPDLPDSDKPLAEVNMELKELSTDAVPEEVFAIPSGYKEAPMDELVKGMTAAFSGAKQ